MANANQGKKGRKFGRHRSRSPAMANYRLVKKWLINKKHNMDRYQKAVEDKKTNPPKVERGTARKARRIGLTRKG